MSAAGKAADYPVAGALLGGAGQRSAAVDAMAIHGGGVTAWKVLWEYSGAGKFGKSLNVSALL